jgi:glycine/D-amino acid oxidase-like deaminating enzyme
MLPWSDAPAPAFPPVSEALDTDVAVIGGGITGITLAWTLAEQGAAVTVLEAGRLAGEASSRNAGFLLAIPSEPYAERVALWGRDGARALLHVCRRSHRRIASWVESLKLDCGYRLSGSLRITRSEEESEDLRASLPELRHDGFPMRELPLADVLPAHARKGSTARSRCPRTGS